MPWINAGIGLVALLGVMVMMYPHVASWVAQYYQSLIIEDIDAVGRLIERDIHSIPHVRETFTILTFEAFGGR